MRLRGALSRGVIGCRGRFNVKGMGGQVSGPCFKGNEVSMRDYLCRNASVAVRFSRVRGCSRRYGSYE